MAKIWWDKKAQRVAISVVEDHGHGFRENITGEPPTPRCMARRAIQVLDRTRQYWDQHGEELEERFQSSANANDVSEFCTIGAYVNYLYRHSPTKTVLRVKVDVADEIAQWLDSMVDEPMRDVWARTHGAGAGWARRSAREFVEDFYELAETIPTDAPKAEGVDYIFSPTHKPNSMECEECVYIINHSHAKIGADCKPQQVAQYTNSGRATGYKWETHKYCINSQQKGGQE